MAFVARTVQATPQTLGEKLRTLRRSQAVSLEALCQSTRIQRRYLTALEWGNYDALPEPVYVRNFLRMYAGALHADPTYFLELYEEEVRRSDLLAPHRLPRERVGRRRLRTVSHLFSWIGLGVAGVCVLGFLGWQGARYLAEPTLTLISPEEEAVISSYRTEVVGGVHDTDVAVAINGVPVPVGTDLFFHRTVDLVEGPNTITITARRRHSRTATIVRHVVVVPEK